MTISHGSLAAMLHNEQNTKSANGNSLITTILPSSSKGSKNQAPKNPQFKIKKVMVIPLRRC